MYRSIDNNIMLKGYFNAQTELINKKVNSYETDKLFRRIEIVTYIINKLISIFKK